MAVQTCIEAANVVHRGRLYSETRQTYVATGRESRQVSVRQACEIACVFGEQPLFTTNRNEQQL